MRLLLITRRVTAADNFLKVNHENLFYTTYKYAPATLNSSDLPLLIQGTCTHSYDTIPFEKRLEALILSEYTGYIGEY
jgi:hypothetical protein